MRGFRWRVIVIAILMLLSVIVDSVYYLVSAATDALFMAGVVLVAWPVVKKMWSGERK